MTKMEKKAYTTKRVMEWLEDTLRKGGVEIYRTGDNLNTITFAISDLLEDEEDVYGSIKFTLHKEGFDLDAEIEEFELVLEEKEKKEKEKAAEKAREAKKDAYNENIYAARKEAKAKKRAALHEAAEAYRKEKESK